MTVSEVLREHLSGAQGHKTGRFGISADRLDALSNGEEASLAELRQIADGLGYSLSDLVNPSSEDLPLNILFRQSLGDRATKHSQTLTTLSHQIHRTIGILQHEEPTSPIRIRGEHLTAVDAERDAIEFRSLYFHSNLYDPLLSLPTIVSELLGVVLLIPKGLRMDGACAVIDNTPIIVLSPRFQGRMLFTLAHEVGHLVAHWDHLRQFAVFDPENSTGNSFHSRRGEERYSDCFAASLLLPGAGVASALKVIRKLYRINSDAIGDVELLLLSRIYGVSFQVASMRCETLGLLPRGGASALYEQLRKNHDSPEKRADELELPQRPQFFVPPVPKKSFQRLADQIQRGEVSIGRAASALNMSVRDLIELNRRLASEPTV